MRTRKCLALLMAAVLLCGTLAGSASAASQPSNTSAGSEELKQLTMEDIRKLNGGDVRCSTDAEGNITFLAGKFYDGKIENGDDVEKALWGMHKLIGADENTVYQKGNGIRIDNGYTYYTLQQWHGEMAVENAIVKIIVDPNGEAAAIASSVKAGIDAGTEMVISPEEAVKRVRAHLAETDPETAYTFYEDRVEKATVSYDGSFYNTYIVYTNNPESSVEETDFPYLAHYVSSVGDYLYDAPTFRIGAGELQSGGSSESFFTGKEALTYTGTVTRADGSKEALTVPVLRDKKAGTYYLADGKRKIAVADYGKFVSDDEAGAFLTSEKNGGWENQDLLTFASYMNMYDFYDDIGWASTDGRGTPVLVLTGMCDGEGNPVDNACYAGAERGWQIFAASDINKYSSDCLDVVGHEYTHGVTTAILTSVLYENETGAINEAMSDIMGNLAEMLLDATDDTTWAIAENCGKPIRSMTDPHAFKQPAFVGDRFFGPETGSPSNDLNDRGGVHVNNSILASIPPLLQKAGMSLDDQARLWLTAICALTPESNYADFYHIFSNAAEISGLGQYQKKIDEIFTNLRIIGANAGKQPSQIKGCGRFSLKADPAAGEYTPGYIAIYDADTMERVCRTWGDRNHQLSGFVPEGNYYFEFRALHNEDGAKADFVYSKNGWSLDEEAKIPVSIKDGKTVALKDFTA